MNAPFKAHYRELRNRTGGNAFADRAIARSQWVCQDRIIAPMVESRVRTTNRQSTAFLIKRVLPCRRPLHFKKLISAPPVFLLPEDVALVCAVGKRLL